MAEEEVPAHHSFPLRDRWVEQMSAEGPQQPAGEPAFTLDELEGGAMLGHRPLSKHLAGDDEGSADLLHEGGGLAQHEDAAVDARVEPASSAEARPLDHAQVIHPLAHHPDLHAQLPSHLRGEVTSAGFARAAGAEGTREVEREHLDPLLEHQGDGESAV